MNHSMRPDTHHIDENGDTWADALAATVLIVVFVTACVFWVSCQSI